MLFVDPRLSLKSFQAERVPLPSGLRKDIFESTRLQQWVQAAGAGEFALELEMGCGVGWHSIAYAQNHPQTRLIAIEKTAEKYAKFLGRYQRSHSPSNLLPIHGDSISWVTHCIPEGVLSRIFLLYPNLESKNPQARWFRMPFMGFLKKRLKKGGLFELRTNRQEYAEEAELYAREAWGWKLAWKVEFDREGRPSELETTHFEKKYLERGETCIRLGFQT